MPSAIRGHISRAANAKLAVLIVTNFVDMVGLLMIIPLMPFYAREMGGGALIVAILMGAFTAAQLLSAPWWGRFSDRYGRRPALLVGLTAAVARSVSSRRTSPIQSSRPIVPRPLAGFPPPPTSELRSDRHLDPPHCALDHAVPD